jgi:hypothetical protein
MDKVYMGGSQGLWEVKVQKYMKQQKVGREAGCHIK